MSWKITSDKDFDTIENDNISIKAARLGAELISLKINHPDLGWTGLLVNDDNTNPDHNYWKRHAPFLFPIVGGLHNDKSVTSDGKEISLPSHGFARISTFTLSDSGSEDNCAWIEYTLKRTQDAPHTYPWDCTLTIRYTLFDKRLETDITVANDSKETMWFQFGWHPGFMAPISGDAAKRKNVEITLPEGSYRVKDVDPDCFLTNNDRTIEISEPLRLTDKELKDTFILDMEALDKRWVSLYDPESRIKTTLTFDLHPHLGLWALPNAPYICLEPWQGCDDFVEQSHFDEKFGISSLKAGKADYRTITTTVEY